MGDKKTNNDDENAENINEENRNFTFNNNEDNNESNDMKKDNIRDETINTIKNIIKNKIEEYSLKSDNIFQFLQPDKFSYGRNMYPHVFKELETTIKYKAKKDY